MYIMISYPMFTDGHIQLEMYFSILQAYKGSQIQASAQSSTSSSVVIQLCSGVGVGLWGYRCKCVG